MKETAYKCPLSSRNQIKSYSGVFWKFSVLCSLILFTKKVHMVVSTFSEQVNVCIYYSTLMQNLFRYIQTCKWNLVRAHTINT